MNKQKLIILMLGIITMLIIGCSTSTPIKENKTFVTCMSESIEITKTIDKIIYKDKNCNNTISNILKITNTTQLKYVLLIKDNKRLEDDLKECYELKDYTGNETLDEARQELAKCRINLTNAKDEYEDNITDINTTCTNNISTLNSNCASNLVSTISVYQTNITNKDTLILSLNTSLNTCLNIT